MKKIIPMMTPPITTYPSIANVLSLLWSRKEQIMPWFSDHFIQLVVRPSHENTFGDFYDHADLDNFYRILYGLPGLGWMRVNRDTAVFPAFTDYIEYLINGDYCLEACLDRYYFKFSKNFGKDHFIHSTLIYGYDDEAREVYIADFFSNSKYEHQVVSYDEVNQAMNNDGIINLFKAWDDSYKFNRKLMKKYFEDYLNSTDSFNRYFSSNKHYNNDALFGLAYYDYLLKRFMEDDYIDFRMYHLLFDHKQLMKNRLEYLATQQIYSDEQMNELREKNDVLIEESMNLRGCVLKYMMRPSEKMRENIANRLMELKKLDKVFTEAVISGLAE